MTELEALRNRVAAGERWEDLPDALQQHADLCRKAFDGSLDAAEALHQALLPRWEWALGRTVPTAVFRPNGRGYRQHFMPENPARAWLLVILDVLIANAASEQ